MSRRTDSVGHLWLHLFLLVMVVITVYPILWVLSVAFSGGQSLAFADLPPDPGVLDRLRAIVPWPEQLTWSNFSDVFSQQPFGRWLLNSTIVAGATTLCGVFLASTAGYAFSRFKFPGRRAGMMGFLVSQMFPGTLTLVPLYIIIVVWLELGSNFLGLILLYSTTAIPFCVWMLKGYFDTIPIELEESAKMDGASALTIFYRIILPLSKPAIAVTALFSFMTAWNEFVLALTIMDQEIMYTAPVGLRFFVGGYAEQQWGYFAAGSIVAALPVMILFLILQRYLISGLTAGAVKG
ncbi:MAG: sugar ABC transporter permease [bacterium]|nr:sugar ABC transporter permease [bacterium]